MTAFLHEQLKEIYDLWMSLKGDKLAPSFESMMPVTLGKASEDMAVISVEREGEAIDFKFIAIGFRLADQFNGAVYGKKVSELDSDYLRSTLRTRYLEVLKNKEPLFGKGDRELDHAPRSYEALTLPLINPGTGDITHLISSVHYYTVKEYRSRHGVAEDLGPVPIED